MVWNEQMSKRPRPAVGKSRCEKPPFSLLGLDEPACRIFILQRVTYEVIAKTFYRWERFMSIKTISRQLRPVTTGLWTNTQRGFLEMCSQWETDAELRGVLAANQSFFFFKKHLNYENKFMIDFTQKNKACVIKQSSHFLHSYRINSQHVFSQTI